MDHPDALKECPTVKNYTRTHVHFGMHKFELIQKEITSDKETNIKDQFKQPNSNIKNNESPQKNNRINE